MRATPSSANRPFDGTPSMTITLTGNSAPALLCRLKRPVRRRLRKAIRGHDANGWVRPVSRNHRGRYRLHPSHGDVRRAARVEELGEHVAALGMDRIRDASPPGGVLVAEDRRRPSVAAP